MPNSDAELLRVSVHAGAAHVDLMLPSEIPVAALITLVIDLLPAQPLREPLLPYRLCPAGGSALDGSRTLTQQGIRNGSMLLLTRAEYPDPVVLFDDPAEQVAAWVRAAANPGSPTARRLTAALLASGLVGVAGFTAVPGGFGAPKVLLALAAAGTVALACLSTVGCRGPAHATLCGLAGLAIATAVAGILAAVTGVSLPAVGAAAVVTGIIVIRAAGRVAEAITGLSRQPSASASHTDRACAALTGIVVSAATAVVLGGVGVATGAIGSGAPYPVGVVFTAAAGAALALRARSHADSTQVAALVGGGAATVGTALLAAATWTGRLWPAAVAAALAGLILRLGFAPSPSSPLAGRAADVAEGLTLGAVVPLACWLCGCYGLASPLSLG